MKRGLILLFITCFGLTTFGQRLMERKRPEIIPTDGKMRRGGFYFAPGVTYTLARFKDQERELFREGDTVYTATFDPKGGFGPYLEVGWFHATRDAVILDYWDFGIAYKALNGKQSHTGILQRGFNENDTTVLTAGDGVFNDQYLTVHANANKFIQTGNYQFVQLSLGLNADWGFSQARTYTADPFVIADQELPPTFLAQAHVKVGYGFKVSKRLLIIPAVETPVFSALPSDQGAGQLHWFNSRYRPLILSVRFLFLRYPKGFECPPVIKHNAFEGKKHKEYKPDTYHP